MAISIKELDYVIESGLKNDEIILLPESLTSGEAKVYASTSISLLKILRKAKIKANFLEEPEILLEQRGAEWLAPTLLVVSSIYNSNPDFFNQLVEIIKNHVISLYPSTKDHEIKLEINIQKTKTKKTTSIKYEGTTDGLKELSKNLGKICKDDK